MVVGLQDALFPGERADQHEQRRFRQVEIGEQALHHLEPEARVNEKIGFALELATGGAALKRAQRGRSDREYTPVFQDWLWHVYLPIVSYLTMMVAGLLLQKDTMSALFGVAAATLLLLFVGIHNAWDSVTYIALSRAPDI